MVDQGFVALGRVLALVTRVQEPLVLNLKKGPGINMLPNKGHNGCGWLVLGWILGTAGRIKGQIRKNREKKKINK